MSSTENTLPLELHTKPSERVSYYLYFTGQNAVYTIVTLFMTTYLMFLNVDLVKAGSIMLAVKVWDAVNDAIFGVIFDSFKFKNKKKFTPWLKISAILVPITTILLFIIPKGAGENLKLAWFAIAYILWDTAYTLCDVPAFGLITAMSNNINERNSILSYKSIWAAGGAGFAYIIATVAISEKVGGNFGIVAIIIAAMALITMLPISFKAKERFVVEDEEEFTLKRMVTYIIKNKYLLIYYLGFLFYSGLNAGGALNLFVSYYLFNSSMFSLLVLAISVVPSLVIALLVPKIIKKIDKMKVYLWSVMLSIILGIIIWLVGYKNITLFVILSILRAIPLAVVGVVMFMFTPDCAEYGKFTSGIDAKGITFAIQTFMAKLTAAISSALGLFLLGLNYTGWQSVSVENFQQLQQLNIVQSTHSLNVLWFIYAMVPVIGCILAFVVWSFYGLKDKDIQIMTDCNAGLISKEEALSLLSKKY